MAGAGTYTTGFLAESGVHVLATSSDETDHTVLTPLDDHCINEYLLEGKSDCKAAAGIGKVEWLDGTPPADCFEASGSAYAMLHGNFVSAAGGIARSADCDNIEPDDALDYVLPLAWLPAMIDHTLRPVVEYVDFGQRPTAPPHNATSFLLLEADLTELEISYVHDALLVTILNDLALLMPDLADAPPPLVSAYDLLKQSLETSVRSIELSELRVYVSERNDDAQGGS